MKLRCLAVVTAAIAASCSSAIDATEPTGAGTVSSVESDENNVPIATLDASLGASRGAALDVRTSGCGPRESFGSASLVDRELAITAAHVVAGATEVTVIDSDRTEHRASVVAFDPDLDIAIIRVQADIGTPLQFRDARVEQGDVGTIAVARGRDDTGGMVTTDVEVGVLRRANVATTDIYRNADVVRPGFEIAAPVEPGDSGAVVVIDGAAAGVVWSRSIERGDRAWVVNIPQAYRDPDTRRSLVESVSTGECA
jgi:S1-C subfamily serine protease